MGGRLMDGFSEDLKKILEDQILQYLARQREALSWYEVHTQNLVETRERLKIVNEELEKLAEYNKQLDQIEA